MTHDEILAALVAERFTYLPETPSQAPKPLSDNMQAAYDWLLAEQRRDELKEAS